ncbi:hypothetical protein JX265_013815 [Neoarthrinium moseri]|uniref:Uncharacterized protein n=1 Tax=Neoarthrinium moseri TaxID=1658444 RepID=A0A9Q0AHC0_9PEZI|nr:hypothetical protein JX265_013815 [Neoarthrinium moseri]
MKKAGALPAFRKQLLVIAVLALCCFSLAQFCGYQLFKDSSQQPWLVDWGSTAPVRWKVIMGCVAAMWLLHFSRWLGRKALNPSHRMQVTWENEIVAVTGGSGDIGKAIIQKLEEVGATTIIMDIAPPGYQKGPKTFFFQTDVCSFESVNRTHRRIRNTIGDPTMLIASAGYLNSKTILDSTEHDLRRTLDVNVVGVLSCIKAFLPHMLAVNNGHIMVISSVKAFISTANSVDYSSSKAAVMSIMEGLQTELKHRYGNPLVKASLLLPSVVKTKMTDNVKQPINRFILPLLEPAEVADRMLQVLENGESDVLMIPRVANLAPWIHSLPPWVRVILQDISRNAIVSSGGLEERENKVAIE